MDDPQAGLVVAGANWGFGGTEAVARLSLNKLLGDTVLKGVIANDHNSSTGVQQWQGLFKRS